MIRSSPREFTELSTESVHVLRFDFTREDFLDSVKPAFDVLNKHLGELPDYHPGKVIMCGPFAYRRCVALDRKGERAKGSEDFCEHSRAHGRISGV